MEKRGKSGANVLVLGNKCYRCNHIWIQRNSELPETCPKCKSPFWNKPRKRKNGKQRIRY